MVILPYESGKNAFDLGMEYQQWLPLDAPFEKEILQHVPAKLCGHDSNHIAAPAAQIYSPPCKK